ncbi:MAG: hypothetical protein ACQ5SW_05180 [Sphaerochaetaceae bacterium]
MRRHARETIRRPKEFDSDFEWTSDNEEIPKKASRKPKDHELDDDRYEVDEDEES